MNGRRSGRAIPIVFFIVIASVLSMVTADCAYGSFFLAESEKTELVKESIFESELILGAKSGEEIGLGDSFEISPVVRNVATEEMYVFLQITEPFVDGEPFYQCSVNENWMEVEKKDGVIVYAYVNSEWKLRALGIGESTDPLTTQMTMRNIRKEVYVGIQNINVKVNSYAVCFDGMTDDPVLGWRCVRECGG